LLNFVVQIIKFKLNSNGALVEHKLSFAFTY